MHARPGQAIHRAATLPRDSKGALVVFAAGNDDREILDDEVEALPDVLCVSAVDSYGRWTNYTNRGATIDVSAPSATVTLSVNGGTMVNFGGTSAAAPVVSGLAAWIASVAPELTAAELMELLVSTAVQSPRITPDENGFHEIFGWGIVSPHAILERLFPPADPDAGPDAGLDAGPDATVDAAPDAAIPTGGGPAAVATRRPPPRPPRGRSSRSRSSCSVEEGSEEDATSRRRSRGRGHAPPKAPKRHGRADDG